MKPNYQVKANGMRTRTYSYSNMGWDNAVSFANYIYQCEGAENVRFIEHREDGTTVERVVDDKFESYM